jgi:two-component system OmpR family sensor kinase
MGFKQRFGVENWSLRNRLVLATLALATVAIISSDFAASTALRSFLVTQVDTGLVGVADQTTLRLDRAGLDSAPTDEGPFHTLRPLASVPTSTSITVLDDEGNIVGHVGGDFGPTSAGSTLFQGFTPAKAVGYKGKPFTLSEKGNLPDLRVVARILPSGIGTIVVSAPLDNVDKTLQHLRWLYLLISLIVLGAIGVIGQLIIRLSMRPLTNIEETARAIAGGDLSARLHEDASNTEVGRLTQSLNTMLGRIEESFAVRIDSENKLRRFVADASHELRTPLTAIRGFAELHRQGAVSGTEKTKELIGRIEKESVRMSSLVEDLLLLARLDQQRELKSEPVDVVQLIGEAMASAQAAGPDHLFTTEVHGEEIFVLGDSQRIHQAVGNLLANARTHTPAGTQVKLEVTQSEAEVVIAVSDNGPGIADEDLNRIFERFYRADASRVRSSGEGTGLGLAIVSAVMTAMGGSVSVKSVLGLGTNFALHFPLIAD